MPLSSTLRMTSPSAARARMETDLRAAITRGEIRPFYQPIVALPAQDLVGFEVLARWDSPEHGPVPPDIFIPIAEETGMISDLSRRILRQACSDARSWPQAHVDRLLDQVSKILGFFKGLRRRLGLGHDRDYLS